jgi:DNA-binding transcriptional ArsR family regulator
MNDIQRTAAALTSTIRREILWMVWERELAAGEIAAAFDVSAPTVSTHLAALRNAGLVTMRVDGNFRRYRAEREAVDTVRSLLASEDDRWQVADDLPEQELADRDTLRLVEATVDVPLTVHDAFDAFVNDATYSAFMGVPVRIQDGEFTCTLEWGTIVRGKYDVVVPPQLIALRWDFEDEQLPVPGEELTGYMRFGPAEPGPGTRVVVHQHARDVEQARFMEVAWGMVLGRFKQYADERTPEPAPRATRPKRSRPC